MMDASGFRNVRKIGTRRPVKFPRRIAIIISSENIRASAIFRRAISLHAQQRKFATKAAAWARADAAFISILPTRSNASVNITIRERYGNLFEIYEKITGEDAYKVPMRIYPAVHYTMGGLWVDYNLMSNVPGLHVIGEANFPITARIGSARALSCRDWRTAILFCPIRSRIISRDRWESGRRWILRSFEKAENDVRARIEKLLDINGNRSVDSFHRELGLLLWDKCGMARNAAGLNEALKRIPALREEFWRDVRVPGDGEEFNQSLERAGRVADFLEFGELMCIDALKRDESCGGHFREEHQTPDGEALRDDEHFADVFAWEYQGERNNAPPKLHREPLDLRNRAANAEEL